MTKRWWIKLRSRIGSSLPISMLTKFDKFMTTLVTVVKPAPLTFGLASWEKMWLNTLHCGDWARYVLGHVINSTCSKTQSLTWNSQPAPRPFLSTLHLFKGLLTTIEIQNPVRLSHSRMCLNADSLRASLGTSTRMTSRFLPSNHN